MQTALDTDTPTVADALTCARSKLVQRLDAELLLAWVLHLTRSQLYTRPQQNLTPAQWQGYLALVERRAGGEPLAYLTGEREFRSLSFRVTAATLVPRPETELLVELALACIPLDRPCRVADLGTGSGAVAIAIARERPLADIVATDNSQAALAVARDNAERLDCPQIDFRHGDWLQALVAEHFDVIVSNPPYVKERDAALDSDGVRFEPRAALAAGPDGLADLRRIIAAAGWHLYQRGWLLLEHGHDQALALNGLLQQSGFGSIRCHADLAGHPRVSAAQFTG